MTLKNWDRSFSS